MPRKAPKTRSPADTDTPVQGGEGLTVTQHITACLKEAEDARRTRLARNRINRDMYLGEQDFSYKQAGQSTEFLPKVAMAAEQMSAFIKKGLLSFGDWFSAEFGAGVPVIISPEQVREIIKCHLNTIITTNNKKTNFAVLLSDTIKSGLLESLMVLKVHGYMESERTFKIEPGEPIVNADFTVEYPENLVASTQKVWRPRIDLVRSEDYYPDPTGRGLYEIHEVERDFSSVVAMAEAGIYDIEVVNQIKEDYEKESDAKRSAKERGQDEALTPDFRRTIVITEYWGNLLDADGRLAENNILAAMANRKYLIRKPEPNPFWHGESPFVCSSILRVPHSVWHKALYDHAAQLNIALNELFNLMLDGGLAQVWGIKQIRVDALSDPSQISGGIPQGTTLSVKDTLPVGAKVMEQVSEGEVPPDAKAIYEMLQSEFAQAALSNELKLGGLPQRNTLATEIVSQDQAQAITMESIIADIESTLLADTLRKLWLTILQNADDLAGSAVVSAIGPAGALTLARLTQEQRFVLFNNCSFKVFGLSETLNKAKDFQKLMALLQAITVNPMLLQAFFTRYSPDKIIQLSMKALNINPTRIANTEAEAAALPQLMAQLPIFMEMAGGSRNPNTNSAAPSAGAVGDSQLPAEINQQVNPMTGMTANQ